MTEGAAQEDAKANRSERADHAVVWVKRVFWISGIVRGADGQALPGIPIWVHDRLDTCLKDLEWSKLRYQVTGVDGTFKVGPFAEQGDGVTDAPNDAKPYDGLFFCSDKGDYAVTRVLPHEVPIGARSHLVVDMRRGVTLAGSLVDSTGRPLAGARLVLEHDTGGLYAGQVIKTDQAGRWIFEAVPAGTARLLARACDREARLATSVTVEDRDLLDLRLVADDFRPPRIPASISVLGLGVCDVDDALRVAYDLPAEVHVMVVDPWPPGARPTDVGTWAEGGPARGDGVTLVGGRLPASVRDAIEQLLSSAERSPGDPAPMVSLGFLKWDGTRLVPFLNEIGNFGGSNMVAGVSLTEEDRKQLEATLATLPK